MSFGATMALSAFRASPLGTSAREGLRATFSSPELAAGAHRASAVFSWSE